MSGLVIVVLAASVLSADPGAPPQACTDCGGGVYHGDSNGKGYCTSRSPSKRAWKPKCPKGDRRQSRTPPGLGRQTALRHWNAGIIAYQKGDKGKAREEWLLCRQADPRNSGCQQGLQRIDQDSGGKP